MDPRTVKFLVFIVFSLLCLAAGYMARKRGILREESSRAIHYWSVVIFWSPVSLIAFWSLQLTGSDGNQLLRLMLIQPVLMIAAALVIAPVARWLGCSRPQTGVMILASALSNTGFTLGAYLCYALLTPPDKAMGFGIAYVTSMQVFMVLLFYPIAHRMAPREEQVALPTMRQTVIESFLSLRAMPLYMAVAGAVLQLCHVKVPDEIEAWHLRDTIFFLGAAGSYAAIGMRLRLGDSLKFKRMHALLAFAHFILWPLLTIALLALLSVAGVPLIGLPRDVVILEAFTPMAINVVIIANLFHLDARLASVLWLWNTLLFAAVVLPVLVFWR